MAPPKKYGPTIQFRLPLHLNAIVEERAAHHQCSPSEYVRQRYTAQLEEVLRVNAAKKAVESAAARPHNPQPKTSKKKAD